MPSKQLKVTFQLPDPLAELAGQALFSYFPEGLLTQPSKSSLTPLLGWPAKSDPKSLESLKSVLLSYGASKIRFQYFRPRDWVRDYKSRFPLQTLGKFVVLPEWRRRSKIPKGKHSIVLMQGQAFGTGLHDSTRLMLTAVSKEAPESVLDIGAGSGILGFAALRLGAKKVVSVEIEEAACDEMRKNARLNGYTPAQFEVRCGAFPKVLRGRRVKADLVLANIITPVLCALMKPIAASARKGGVVLFSGIHTEAEARQVAAAAQKAGLRVTGRQSKGSWFCLRAQK